MESLGSRFFKSCLFILQRRRFWSTGGDKFDEKIKKKQERSNQDIPSFMYKKFNVTWGSFEGCRYYIVKPLTNPTKQLVLYLHGGGYVVPISKFHWAFIGALVKNTGCTVFVPLYPLAPANTWRETFNFLMPLYTKLIEKVKDMTEVTIMGDSAGGGLALSLALCIKEQKLRQPSQIILLSPWLDISMKNPEIYKIMNHDLMLGDKGAIRAANYYARGVDKTHYIVSPLYGDFTNITKVILFIGSADMLSPDCEKLHQKFVDNNLPMDYYLYPKMMHVFPLFHFKEARNAKKKIYDYLRK